MPKIIDTSPARGSIIRLMAAALQAGLISRHGIDLDVADCETIMAAVLERSGAAAKTSNEQAHESQRLDR
jgi:hypothetical protein